ncbi:hypothetical protein C8R47DRAFT_1116784 [Mycena vitilis]|nr:hypothetical protein C8R47DRAFT_1116784 [Mycena vitilis]
MPAGRDGPRSPVKRGRRRREFTLDPSMEIFGGDPTTIAPVTATIPQTTPSDAPCRTTTRPTTLSSETIDVKAITIAERRLSLDAARAPDRAGPALSRHFKSPSLGTIHHLLSASTSATDVPDNTPRVRCRKRTNTLSAAEAGTKRYGVYTSGKLDFSPVAPEEDVRIHSTYSLGALLASYSCDSLPSMYSQESFIGEHGTRPLRVKVRSLQGQQVAEGRAHPMVLQLIRDVDVAIEEWL